MIGMGARSIAFTGLEPVTISDFAELNMVMPNSRDLLHIDSPDAGQNRVRGTSGGVEFEALTFFDITNFILNTGAADGAFPSDVITIHPPGLVAAGLERFRLIGGVGDDTLNLDSGFLAFLSDAGDDCANLTVNVANGAIASFETTQHLAGLNISPGGLGLLTPGGDKVLVTESLGVFGAGRLDLADNDAIIDYPAASPIAAIQDMLETGYAAGTWAGPGINTSLGDATTLALGYAEAADVATDGEFSGEPVDATAVLIMFSRYGDANLSGNVDLVDFNRLVANFGASPRRWAAGNFDYDNDTDLSDFNKLAANFGSGAMPDASTGDPDRDDEAIESIADLLGV
jgi:hypothetical protein